MKRYTERIRENEYATGNAIIKELKIDENNEDKDYILERQKNIINTLNNKLGKIEDLMEKYHIRDVEHLEKTLEAFEFSKLGKIFPDYLQKIEKESER